MINHGSPISTIVNMYQRWLPAYVISTDYSDHHYLTNDLTTILNRKFTHHALVPMWRGINHHHFTTEPGFEPPPGSTAATPPAATIVTCAQLEIPRCEVGASSLARLRGWNYGEETTTRNGRRTCQMLELWWRFNRNYVPELDFYLITIVGIYNANQCLHPWGVLNVFDQSKNIIHSP